MFPLSDHIMMVHHDMSHKKEEVLNKVKCWHHFLSYKTQVFHSVKVKFICAAHFMYKTIQSALHKIKALQQGAEKALKICKII